MTALAPSLAAFLREHLPRDRRASPHTCEAYAYSFQLLVTFAGQRLGTKPSQLEVEHLDVPMILAFLDTLKRNAAIPLDHATPAWPPSRRSSASWNIACPPASIRLCACMRSR